MFRWGVGAKAGDEKHEPEDGQGHREQPGGEVGVGGEAGEEAGQ